MCGTSLVRPCWSAKGQGPLQGSMGHFENRSSIIHPEANLTDASRVLQQTSRVFNWPITQLDIDWLLSDMQEGDQTSVTLGLRHPAQLSGSRPAMRNLLHSASLLISRPRIDIPLSCRVPPYAQHPTRRCPRHGAGYCADRCAVRAKKTDRDNGVVEPLLGRRVWYGRAHH